MPRFGVNQTFSRQPEEEEQQQLLPFVDLSAIAAGKNSYNVVFST